MFAHMRLYYGWLKARFNDRPCDIYKGVCSANPEIQAQLQRIQQFHEQMNIDVDTMNWRAWLTQLWKTDRREYERTIETAGGQHNPVNRPLSEEQLAYWNAWLNPPTLSPTLIRFFDQYVHDSRAGFLRIDSSGYLKPRQIIEVKGVRATASQAEIAPVPAAQASAASYFAFSGV